MKKKITGRRILSLLLAAVLATSLCVPALASETGSLSNFTQKQTYDGRFTDVKQSAYYYEGVKLCYETGILNGTSATTFSPESNITADQLTIIAARIYNIYHGGTGEIPVSDRWPNAGYGTKAFYYLEDELGENNIAHAWGTGSDPHVMRFSLGIIGQVLDDEALQPINHLTAVPDFNSFPTAPDYQCKGMEEQVLRLYNAGVLTGSDEYGTFHCTSYITRGAVAAIVARIADPAQRKVLTLKKGAAPIVGVASLALENCKNLQSVVKKYEGKTSSEIGLVRFSYVTPSGVGLKLEIQESDNSYTVSGLDFGEDGKAQYEMVFALIDDVVEESSRAKIKEMLQSHNDLLAKDYNPETGISQEALDWEEKNSGKTTRIGNVNFTWSNRYCTGFTIAKAN